MNYSLNGEIQMKILAVAALSLTLAASSAYADDFSINLDKGLSGNVTGMTDYVQRGISQTYGQRINAKLGHSSDYSMNTTMFPAVGAGASYTLGNGLFAGVSGINSNQGNNSFENDVTVGWKTAITSNILYQFSVNYQNYPGSSNYNNLSTVEFQNIVNYVQPWGKLVGAFAVQPQGQNHSGGYTYTTVGVDLNLPNKFVGTTRVGYNTYSNHSSKPNYVDWTVGVSRPIAANVSVGIQYTGSTDYVELGNGNRVVGMVLVSF